MASPSYMPKTRAVAILQEETGYGRRIIENAMDKLQEAERIHIHEDPLDGRKLRISQADIDLVRRILKGEEQL